MKVKIIKAKTSKDLETDVNTFLLLGLIKEAIIDIKIGFVNPYWFAIIVYGEGKK